MIISEPFRFTYQNRPASLCVVRNDGYCWAEIEVAGKRLSVSTDEDHYERTDEDAAAAFIEAAANPNRVEPSLLAARRQGDLTPYARNGYAGKPNPHIYSSACFYAHALGAHFKQVGITRPFYVRMSRGHRIHANDMLFKIEGDSQASLRFIRER